MYNDEIEVVKLEEIDYEEAVNEFNYLVYTGQLTNVYDYAFERGFTTKALDKFLTHLTK